MRYFLISLFLLAGNLLFAQPQSGGGPLVEVQNNGTRLAVVPGGIIRLNAGSGTSGGWNAATHTFTITTSGAGLGDASAAHTGLTFTGAVTLTATSNTVDTFTGTITGTVTSVTVSGASTGEYITVRACEDGTGGHPWTWGAAFQNTGAVETTASACSSQTFWYDGANFQAQGILTVTNAPAGDAILLSSATGGGSVKITPANGAANTTWTVPLVNDQAVGVSTTDTLQNKNVDTANGNTIAFGGSSVTGVQGNSGKVMEAGTVSGTGATLCTDVNGNATTAGCAGGGGGGGAFFLAGSMGGGQVINASTTVAYMPFGAQGATVGGFYGTSPWSATLTKFYITPRANGTSQSATGGVTCDFWVNDVEQTSGPKIVVAAGTTLPANNTSPYSFSDTAHSLALSIGDNVEMRCVNAATAASIPFNAWVLTQ